MPRLTVLERTYGKAIGCLIKLYKQELRFVEELEKLQGVYEPAIIKWLDSSAPEWRQLQAELFRLRSGQGDSAQLSEVSVPLFEQLSCAVRRIYDGWNVTTELINYEKDLRDLAYRWHLKAKWSGLSLMLSHMNDVVGIMSSGYEITTGLPVEVIEPILGKAPLPPLMFRVRALELLYSDQREIVREFASKLSNYERELKSLGWPELPSALERHAHWWFEYHVHKKGYDEIAQAETYTPGGSLISYARNVGEAVRKFSRLLGIKT